MTLFIFEKKSFISEKNDLLRIEITLTEPARSNVSPVHCRDVEYIPLKIKPSLLFGKGPFLRVHVVAGQFFIEWRHGRHHSTNLLQLNFLP